jgi:molybdopterin biosynthesis enzyme
LNAVPELLSIDETLALVLESVQPLEAETVLAVNASGRVLAEDVRTAIDLPPFPSSAMDEGTLGEHERSHPRPRASLFLGRFLRFAGFTCPA